MKISFRRVCIAPVALVIGWASAAAAEPPAIHTRTEEAPAWAVPYGAEFWRRALPGTPATPGRAGDEVTAGLAGPDDLGDVVDRISHSLEMVAGTTAVETHDERAAVQIDDAGFRLTVAGPRAIEPAPEGTRAQAGAVLQAETLGLRRGGRSLLDRAAAGGWSVLGNTAQRQLDALTIEHLEVGRAGVEVSWVLAAVPSGSGALEIEVALDGVEDAGRGPTGHLLADASGKVRVVIGDATAVDSLGTRWDLGSRIEHGRLLVDVPEEVLLAAAFPLAIDPTFGLDFPMDEGEPDGAPDNQTTPDVASDGNGFYVVWWDLEAKRVLGARVGADGALIDFGGTVLCTSCGWPAVAYRSSEYLVVWSDVSVAGNYNVRGRKVNSATGAPDSVIDFAVGAGMQDGAAVVATVDHAQFLVAWTDSSGATDDVKGKTLLVGSNVPSIQFNIAVDAAKHESAPALAAMSGHGGDGIVTIAFVSQPLVGAEEDVRAVTLGDNGGGQIPAFNVSATVGSYEREPKIASDGTDFLVVWNDDRPNPTAEYRIYGQRVSSVGTPIGARVLISSTTPPNDHSDVVFHPVSDPLSAGGTYFICWTADDDAGTEHVWVQEVGRNGALIGAAVSPQGTVNAQTSWSAIASNGNHTFVTWTDLRDIVASEQDVYGTRLTPDLLVLDDPNVLVSPTTAAIGLGQTQPAIAKNANDYLLVWTDRRNGNQDIYGTRIRKSDSAVLDPAGIRIGVGGGNQRGPSVASDGTDFAVVWMADYLDFSCYCFREQVWGNRVPANGAEPNNAGLQISMNPAHTSGMAPKIAARGGGYTGYMAVWQDDRDSALSGVNVYARSMTTNTGVLSPGAEFPVSTATASQTNPGIANDGTSYLVAWSDTRTAGNARDVWGARINETVLGGVSTYSVGTNQPIRTTTKDEFLPLVGAKSGSYLVVWNEVNAGTSIDVQSNFVTRGAGPDALTVNPTVAVSVATGSQLATGVASDGANYLVTWIDERNVFLSIYGARVSGGGVLLDGPPSTGGIRIRDGATFGVSAAKQAGTWLVAYQTPYSGEYRVRARTVTLP